MADVADQNKQLADQITELRSHVVRLQAALHQSASGKRVSPESTINPAPNKGMRMTNDKSGMGMPPGKSDMTSGSMGTKNDQGEMGGMAPRGNAPMSPGMSMVDKGGMNGASTDGRSNTSPAPAMGMCCMGSIASGGNANMSAMPLPTGVKAPAAAATPPVADAMTTISVPSSATPGQTGVSHLYHIGSNGFFLNLSQITLTPDQKLTLNHIQDKATLNHASEQHSIDQAEQEMYALTGADQPNGTGIQAKIFEIEKLRADQRMKFIRAVGDASNVLTPEQRKALLGTMAVNKK